LLISTALLVAKLYIANLSPKEEQTKMLSSSGPKLTKAGFEADEAGERMLAWNAASSADTTWIWSPAAMSSFRDEGDQRNVEIGLARSVGRLNSLTTSSVCTERTTTWEGQSVAMNLPSMLAIHSEEAATDASVSEMRDG
jgi:hypothetical protein